MNNKLLFGLIVLLAFSLKNFAQPGKGKIEAMKIGFFTERLSLTSDEASKFWPVYNKYNSETEALRKNMRGRMMEEMNDLPNMSDAEAEKALNELVALKISEADLLKKYSVEFRKVLPVKKVIMLYKAENDFKRELLNKLQERKRMRD